jgi:hypothetical protein
MPVLFMGGLIGRLFRVFAVTLAIAIAISAVLSLTLTAMMSGWLLRPHEAEHPGAFARAFERGFSATARFYERTLAWVLRHRLATLLATLATVAFTGLLALIVQSTSLGALVGVTEFLKAGGLIIERSTVMQGINPAFEIYGFVLLVYFSVCSVLTWLSRRLERRLGRSIATVHAPDAARL